MSRLLQLALALALPVAAAMLLMPGLASADSQQPLPYFDQSTSVQAEPLFAPGFPFERSTFDGRCTTPSDWISSFSGAGQATHLGAVTVINQHCFQGEWIGAGMLVGGRFTDGEMTMTAANGDVLTFAYGGTMTFTGTFESGTAVVSSDWTITGGTGRFAHAGGHGHTDMVQSAPSWVAVAHSKGVISYDAADRSDK